MSADGNAIVPVDVVQGICAGVGYGVAAYVVSDYGDKAFWVGDCGFAGLETEGYDDDGGGVGGSDMEKLDPGSD